MNTSPQQCYQSLTDLLQNQTTELQTINNYLTQIKNAVADNDVEALDQLVTQQRLPVAEIEDLQIQRQQLMSNYNFDADNTGFEKCIDWCDQQGTLASQYQNFKQELMLLHRSLQISDLLVSKGQNRIRQSLQLLTGQTVNTKTYTSNGQSQDSTDGRSIARV